MPRFVFMAGFIFAAAGALALALGVYLIRDQVLFSSGALQTTGTVTGFAVRRGEDGTVFAPEVEWRDPKGTSHHFTAHIASRSKMYDVGESVPVSYRPAQPGKARLTSFWASWGGPMIATGLGIAFLVAGSFVMWIYISDKRRIADLMERGHPIEARFLYALTDSSIKVAGDHPWRVVCTAPDPETGGKRNFKSEPVWTHPADLEQATFRVLLDPKNPRRYHVDLSGLVPEADRL